MVWRSCGVMLLERSVGFLSLLFHMWREVRSSAWNKTALLQGPCSMVPCQMTPVTLPPMMPRHPPGRGVKIHYTKQNGPSIQRCLSKRNGWDPARHPASDHLHLESAHGQKYNTAGGHGDIQTHTMILFLTMIIFYVTHYWRKTPTKCSTWTANIFSNGQIGTSRVQEPV